jgi:signal transduction histidine kinase
MNIFKILIFSLLIGVVVYVHAAIHPNKLDIELSKAENDSIRVQILIEIGDYYQSYENHENAVLWYEKALNISKKMENRYLVSLAFSKLTPTILANYISDPEVINYAYDALKNYKSSNLESNNFQIGILYVGIAKLHYEHGNHKLSNLYIDSAKYQVNFINDVDYRAKLYTSISEFYLNTSNSDSTYKYIDLCYSLGLRHNNTLAKLLAYRIKSKLYIKLNNYKKAYSYQDSILIWDKSLDAAPFVMELCEDYMTRADIFSGLHKYDSAITNYLKAINLADENNLSQIAIKSYYSIAEVYIKRQMYDSSAFFLDIHLDKSTQKQYYREMLKGYKLKSDIYKLRKDYKQANYYLDRYVNMKDSLFPGTYNISLAMALYKKEIENRDKRNENLSNENESHLETIRNEELKTLGLFILVLIMVMLAGYTFFQYQKARKQTLEISLKTKQIQKQNIEIAKINNDLKKNNESLTRIINEKNDLIAVVSHDLKAPLNRALGLLSILKLDEKNMSAHGAEILSKVIFEIEQGRSLISSILNTESLENEIKNAPKDYFDIIEILPNTVEMFAKQAAKKNINIEANYSHEHIILYGNQQHFERIFDNLVSNAIKFSPRNTTISINVNDSKDFVTLSIADQGPGFTENDKKNLFKKYNKLSSKPTAGESSTGLGLYIVHELVQAMNGELTLESESGKGATFIIKFFRKG